MWVKGWRSKGTGGVERRLSCQPCTPVRVDVQISVSSVHACSMSRSAKIPALSEVDR